MSKFEQSQRILDVQTPVIPVVGTLIRENPGTISLGQGVVYYGPPDNPRTVMAADLAPDDIDCWELLSKCLAAQAKWDDEKIASDHLPIFADLELLPDTAQIADT